MDIKAYLKESAKTDSNDFHMDPKTQKILHAAVGICTESGELLDSLDD